MRVEISRDTHNYRQQDAKSRQVLAEDIDIDAKKLDDIGHGKQVNYPDERRTPT